MSITHTTRRLALLVAMAALLAVLALTSTARAAADPLAQERYYSSFGTPATELAHAQEHAYMTYGEPAPLSVPHADSPTSDTSWLPLAMAVVALTVALGAIQVGRVHVRRRATRVAV